MAKEKSLKQNIQKSLSKEAQELSMSEKLGLVIIKQEAMQKQLIELQTSLIGLVNALQSQGKRKIIT